MAAFLWVVAIILGLASDSLRNPAEHDLNSHHSGPMFAADHFYACVDTCTLFL